MNNLVVARRCLRAVLAGVFGGRHNGNNDNYKECSFRKTEKTFEDGIFFYLCGRWGGEEDP